MRYDRPVDDSWRDVELSDALYRLATARETRAVTLATAEASLARLAALERAVEGTRIPPTPEAVTAHTDAGGFWSFMDPASPHAPIASGDPDVVLSALSDGTAYRWWRLGPDGRPVDP